MNKLYNISIILIFLIVLSSPQTVFSQEERLAVVSTFNGEVRVQHDGVWKTVTKVGNRIRNSSVYNGDTVLTMPGSNVDMIFDDNTHLKVEEDTTLTISIRQITEKERAKEGFVRNVSGTRQEVVRNINVKIGKLWADITPSKSVLTEFESPTGVASVRGTTLIFAFLGGITGIDLIKGLLDFISAINNLAVDFNSGDALNISEPEPGKTKIDVASGEITLKTSEGTVTVGDGATLNVGVDPVTGTLTVVSSEGKVAITKQDGTTKPVGAGDKLGKAGGDDKKNEDGNDAKKDGDDKKNEDGNDAKKDGDDKKNEDGNDAKKDGDDKKNKDGNDAKKDGDDKKGKGNNEDGGDNVGKSGDKTGDKGNKQITDTNPFFGSSVSQSNQTQQESSGSSSSGIQSLTSVFKDNFSSGGFTSPQIAGSDAVIGGSDDWNFTDNAVVRTTLGKNANNQDIIAINGDPNNKFAVVHTGIGNSGLLGKTFNFMESGKRQITFDYNFITREYPIYVNQGVNDFFKAELHLSNGTTVQLAYEDVDTSNFTNVSNLPINLLNGSTGGQTGWKSVDKIVNVPSGLTELHFHVGDVGDNVVDSAALIDNVVDPLVYDEASAFPTEASTPSTDYLLAFARMIRDDDIELEDIEDPDGIESNSASRIDGDSNAEVSLDAIRESLVVVKEFMEGHINDFGNAINHNEIKAQLDTLLAKVDDSMNNGGGISASLRNEIATVLSGIMADHAAHCEEDSVNCYFRNLHLLSNKHG